MKNSSLSFMTALVAALVILAGVTPAFAGAVTWGQAWTLDTNPVDKIELFMVTGQEFGTPATSGPAGWTLTQPNPTYALITGAATPGGTNYTINFSTPTSTPFTMDALEWSGTVLQEHVRFVWLAPDAASYNNHYGDWSWNTVNGSFVDPALAEVQYNRATPEPGSLTMMLGAGLVGIGFIRRRKRAQ